MLALGIYMLSALASVTPTVPAHAVEPVASTYDQAACDPSDSGECAQEDADALALMSTPAILDCDDERVQEMIGSCDLPRPSSPLAPRAAVLHNANHGGGLRLGPAHATAPMHTPPSRGDDDLRTLPASATLRLLPPTGAPLSIARVDHRADAPRHRLERPPRV